MGKCDDFCKSGTGPTIVWAVVLILIIIVVVRIGKENFKTLGVNQHFKSLGRNQHAVPGFISRGVAEHAVPGFISRGVAEHAKPGSAWLPSEHLMYVENAKDAADTDPLEQSLAGLSPYN